MIMAALAAVAVPHFAQTLQARNARHAAIQLADYVDYIRNTAINEGRSASLSVDPNSDRFWSVDVDFPDQPGVPISVLVKDRFEDRLEITASFDDATTLTFDLEGTPTVGGTPLGDGVIVIDAIAVAYEVRIGTGPGRASIVEVEPESPAQASQTQSSGS